MEVKSSVLTISKHLQSPFLELDKKIEVLVDSESLLINLAQKSMCLALSILLYPSCGALYFLGKVIECLTLRLVEEPTKNEEVFSRSSSEEDLSYKGASFEVEEPRGSTSIKKRFKVGASEEDAQEFQRFFTNFQKKANSLYREKTAPARNSLLPPDPEILKQINQFYKTPFPADLPKGFSAICTRSSACIFYDAAPDTVFKVGRFSSDTKEYVEGTVECMNKARDFCNEKGLFLLHIPQTTYAQLDNGSYIIIQERIPIHNPDWDYQKGLYQSLATSSESEAYIREVYLQLATFIAGFGFSDVKWDNIPISDTGHVALFDIDSRSAVAGFLRGGAGVECGLLRAIPPKWQEEIVEKVSHLISGDQKNEISKAMPSKKRQSEKTWSKVRRYAQFAEEKGIITPRQLLGLEQKHLKNLDYEEQVIAKALIQCVNQLMLNNLEYPNLRKARKVSVNFDSMNFEKKLPECMRSYLIISSKLESSLKKLTQARVIFSVKVKHHASLAVVSC